MKQIKDGAEVVITVAETPDEAWDAARALAGTLWSVQVTDKFGIKVAAVPGRRGFYVLLCSQSHDGDGTDGRA